MTGERVVAGRYRVLGPLGRGGMGAVWLAHDGLLGREVAIKEIGLPGGGHGPADPADPLVQRALREAQAAARLHHPGIVTVHDVVTDDGRPWIVMERIHGRSLAQAISEHGMLPERQTAEIGLQVVDALIAAHRAGITHRDVKPANILLGNDRVVLTDFGIAAIDDATAITASGQLVGSPAYLAPERISGNGATAAADLWALGVTLYTAVTGHGPFARDNTLATLAAIVSSPPVPPAHAGRLWPVLSGLLIKDPHQRLTAQQARGLLAAVAHPDTARPPVPAPPGWRRWWQARSRAFAGSPVADGVPPTLTAPPPTIAAPTVSGTAQQQWGSAPDLPAPAARRHLQPRWLAALVAGSLLATGTIAWIALPHLGTDRDDPAGQPSASGRPAPTRVPEYSYAETLLPRRAICAAVWNPQQTLYAVTSADVGLEVYDADGVQTRTFRVPLASQGKCYLNNPGVYWDPTGTTVAVVGGSQFTNHRLYFFDTQTGSTVVAALKPGTVYTHGDWDETGTAVLISSGLDLAVVGKDGTVQRTLLPGTGDSARTLWEVGVPPRGDTFVVNWLDSKAKDSPLFDIRRYSDGSLVSTVGTRSDSGLATLFTFNPAGTLLAVGIGDFGVEIWDPAGKRRIATMREPSGAITDLRWSGNGQYLVVVSHGQQRVHVYRSADWKLLGTLTPHEQTRIGVGVAAAGIGNDGSVMLVPQGARGIDSYRLK